MSSNDRCREAAALIYHHHAGLVAWVDGGTYFEHPLDARVVADYLLDEAARGPSEMGGVLARLILSTWRDAGSPGATDDYDPRYFGEDE